jgi:hypothetical protein
VVVCLLTAVGSLVSAGLISREEMNAQAAYKREKERAQEAEKRFQLAKEWVDETFNVCEEELAGQPPNFDGLRRRLLEHALSYYEKLIEERGDSPDDKGELAANLARVQHILDDLAVMQGDRLVPLLGEAAVLDDLRLPAERRKEIAEMMRRRGKQFGELIRKQGSLEEKKPDFLALARSSEANLEKILTREQLARLRQINLQRQGPRAFEDSQVTTTLKLTAAQREKIRIIQAEAFFGGPRGFGPKLEKPDPMERIVKTVLTGEQAQQWQKLTGEPFKGPQPGPPGSLGPPGSPPFGPKRSPAPRAEPPRPPN